MMHDTTGMMGAVGIVGLLALAVLVLGIGALVKYLFFSQQGRNA